MTVRLPGFCDVHVHFREPGFSYKETIKSGSQAAARGGYTAVCTMPNLNPVPDTVLHLREQLDLISRDACINIYPYASISKGQQGMELSDMEDLAPLCVAFSDDGKGVQSEEMMLRAMLKAKSLGKIIAAHCEDNRLLNDGYIHDGKYARVHGYRGIPGKSEWGQIERDIALAKETGCAYHICHVSCAESVELVRKARSDGVNVTCETAPHYLVLDENDLLEEGRFKMNPPLRSHEDRIELIKGVQDGTISIIATDHAPHSVEEKSRGLEGSAFGITGIETAFPVLYSRLVIPEVISLENLMQLLSGNPRKRFGIPTCNEYCEWDLDTEYEINPENFLSMGKSSPFNGMKVRGTCVKTVCGGREAYKKGE